MERNTYFDFSPPNRVAMTALAINDDVETIRDAEGGGYFERCSGLGEIPDRALELWCFIADDNVSSPEHTPARRDTLFFHGRLLEVGDGVWHYVAS